MADEKLENIKLKYHCGYCGNVFTRFIKDIERAIIVCPKCKNGLRKMEYI